MDWPNCAIGKLNKEENTFEFDEGMLSKLKLTESEVRKHLKAINGGTKEADTQNDGGPGMDTVSRPPDTLPPPLPALSLFYHSSQSCSW